MWVLVVLQDRVLRLPLGRQQLRVLSVSGAVRQHCAPQTKQGRPVGGKGERKGKRRQGRGKGIPTRACAEGTGTGKENDTGRSNAPLLPPRPGTNEKERKLVDDALSKKEDGEGESGDKPWYNLTPEDLRLWEVYRDWVHRNPGTHLDGGITDDGKWQGWCHDLAVIPSRRYKATCGKVVRRYINALVKELRGLRDRRWNSERFIVFQTVTLQRTRHVMASRDIHRPIEKPLDDWDKGHYAMLV